MIYGAHVSIAGGLDKSIEKASALGANALQTFATSPRMVKFNQIPPYILEQYKFLKDQSAIKLHVFHGIYLINLASENLAYVKVCIDALIKHQELASKIGALGTVFHVGSHKGKGFEAVADQVAEALLQILASSPNEVELLLENTAGQNGAIGSSFAELATIKKLVEEKGGDTTHLGLGVDTQHAFGAGFDLTNKEGVETMVNEIDTTWGIDKLKLMHLNDSLVACGSHKDRHANIGEGLIGVSGLKQVVNHPKLSKLPFIVEVPGKNKSGPRKEDVSRLKLLYKEKENE